MAAEWARHVGRAIRARRKELDMGPTAFSAAIHASVKTIERWERGETDGALRQLDEIARVLKTTPAELIAMAPVSDEEADKGETPDLSLNGAGTLDRIERRVDDLHDKVDELLAVVHALSAAVTSADEGLAMLRDLFESVTPKENVAPGSGRAPRRRAAGKSAKGL